MPRDRVALSRTRYGIDVRTRARRVTVYRNGKRVRRFGAVVGKPATPTPHGLAASGLERPFHQAVVVAGHDEAEIEPCQHVEQVRRRPIVIVDDLAQAVHQVRLVQRLLDVKRDAGEVLQSDAHEVAELRERLM